MMILKFQILFDSVVIPTWREVIPPRDGASIGKVELQITRECTIVGAHLDTGLTTIPVKLAVEGRRLFPGDVVEVHIDDIAVTVH